MNPKLETAAPAAHFGFENTLGVDSVKVDLTDRHACEIRM